MLFDGLDEVNQEGERRGKLTRLLQNFAQKYRPSQMLITCRIAASDYLFEGFADVEVADFDRDQIHKYAHQWFGKDVETREAFFEDLYRDDNEGLRELCAQPLLLAMLCLAFADTGHFPQRRVDLYEDALDALLRKWDSSRNIRRDQLYRGLSRQRKMQMFAHIAHQTFKAGEYFIERRRLEKLIAKFLDRLPGVKTAEGEAPDAAVVLQAIEAQHGLFVQRAKDIYAFSHLTFQEYFTARYIADNEARGATRELAHHVSEDRWREVVLLATSLLDEADDFVQQVRETLNARLTADETLHRLTTWANQKSLAANRQDEQRAAVRLAYFYLGRARALARALDQEYGRLLGVDYALLYAQLTSEVLARTSRFEEMQEFIGPFHDYWADLLRFSAEAELAGLTRSLRQITAPAVGQPQAVWQRFTDDLLQIMQRERDIGHPWHLSKEQRQALIEYFNGYLMLVECLDYAIISPETRLSVETGFLLPPEDS